MRDLSELNINYYGEPVLRPPPSGEQIASFERAFGVALPMDLVALLSHSNGGHPELNCAPDLAHDIEWFFFLDEDKEDESSLWSMMGHLREYGCAPELIPFADNGCGDIFVVDSSKAEAPVSMALHEEGYALEPVAPSLAAFIDSLVLVDLDEPAWDYEEPHPPADAELVAMLRAMPGAPWPEAYLALLFAENGTERWLDGAPISVWAAEFLRAFNQAYVPRGKPADLFLFGAGPGARLWGFDARNAQARPVVELPASEPTWERTQPFAADFSEFLALTKSRAEKPWER